MTASLLFSSDFSGCFSFPPPLADQPRPDKCLLQAKPLYLWSSAAVWRSPSEARLALAAAVPTGKRRKQEEVEGGKKKDKTVPLVRRDPLFCPYLPFEKRQVHLPSAGARKTERAFYGTFTH